MKKHEDEKSDKRKEGTLWTPKVLLISALLGALVGVSAAYLLIQNAERKGKTPEISAGEGVKLGLLILGLLRSIASLKE